MIRPIRDWNKGDALSAEHLQEVVDAIRDDRLSTVFKGQRTFFEMRVGKIANAGPNGEADFTDCRYWVKFQRGTSTDGDRFTTLFDDDWSAESSSDPALQTWWLVVENLAERSGTTTTGSHNLAVDQLVICFVVWTSEAPSNRLYVMNQGGVGGLFPVRVAKSNGTDGDATTAASWVYNVTSLGGASLGTDVPLARPRPIGSMLYQVTGYGTAFYDAGVLKLWDAGEVDNAISCV